MGKVLESKSFYGNNWWNNTRLDNVWAVCTVFIKYTVSQNHLGWERPLRSSSRTLPSAPLNHISAPAPLGFPSWGMSWPPSRLSSRRLLSARLLNRSKSVAWRSKVAALLLSPPYLSKNLWSLYPSWPALPTSPSLFTNSSSSRCLPLLAPSPAEKGSSFPLTPDTS